MPTATSDYAFRLLQIQQRLDAFERLYNDEVSALKQEVARLKADFVRQVQIHLQRATGQQAEEQITQGDGAKESDDKPVSKDEEHGERK